jgi:hypothetical protein
VQEDEATQAEPEDPTPQPQEPDDAQPQPQPQLQEPHVVGDDGPGARGTACGLDDFRVDLSEYETRFGCTVEKLLERIETLGERRASQFAAVEVELVLFIYKSAVFDTTEALEESQFALEHAHGRIEQQAQMILCLERQVDLLRRVSQHSPLCV